MAFVRHVRTKPEAAAVQGAGCSSDKLEVRDASSITLTLTSPEVAGSTATINFPERSTLETWRYNLPKYTNRQSFNHSGWHHLSSPGFDNPQDLTIAPNPRIASAVMECLVANVAHISAGGSPLGALAILRSRAPSQRGVFSGLVAVKVFWWVGFSVHARWD